MTDLISPESLLIVISGLISWLLLLTLIFTRRQTFNQLLFAQFSKDMPAEMRGDILVLQGKAQPLSSIRLIAQGGPGDVTVDEYSAVVLEPVYDAPRVVGQGRHMLNQFERVRDSIDLRHQVQQDKAEVVTADGIPITYQYEIEFRIQPAPLSAAAPTQPGCLFFWRPAADQSANALHSFNASDVQRAVYEVTVDEKGQPSRWSGAAAGAAAGAIDEFIASLRFDELRVPYDDMATGGAYSMRRRIQAQAKGQAIEALKRSGAELLSMRILNFNFDGVATGVMDQHFDNWRSKWATEAQRLRADGEANAKRQREETRATTQVELLAKLRDVFDQMNAESAEQIDVNQVLSLRMIETFERMALHPNQNRFMPQEILTMMQQLIKLGEQPK